MILRWLASQSPARVKTVCCRPNDVHHLRPEQVRRNAAGDYEIDIYLFPIPAGRPTAACSKFDLVWRGLVRPRFNPPLANSQIA